MAAKSLDELSFTWDGLVDALSPPKPDKARIRKYNREYMRRYRAKIRKRELREADERRHFKMTVLNGRKTSGPRPHLVAARAKAEALRLARKAEKGDGAGHDTSGPLKPASDRL